MIGASASVYPLTRMRIICMAKVKMLLVPQTPWYQLSTMPPAPAPGTRMKMSTTTIRVRMTANR
jgi:hypothetical protein